MVDVLLVSLGSTAGLRAADAELAASLSRAGASVAVVAARPQRDVRTLALTDFVWARAARAAARLGIEEHRPRAVVYCTVTAALLWPRPGAIRFDAPAAGNRPGRHGVWQRPLERRRLRQAPLLVPQAAGALQEAGSPGTPSVVVPIPVEPSGPAGERDIAAITYAANPSKKGLDRVLAAWAVARREDEELVVTGTDRVPLAPGVRSAGPIAPEAYRALLRRARVFVTAPRREDYGLAQLEALADGCVLVTNAAPGPYAALALARELDGRLVVGGASAGRVTGNERVGDAIAAGGRATGNERAGDAIAAGGRGTGTEGAAIDGLARAIRTALDDPPPGYAERALAAIAPYRREAVDATVRDQLLPALLDTLHRG